MPIFSEKFTRSFIAFLISLVSGFFVLCPEVHSDEGIIWNRIRFRPALTLTEKYSDNIFLSATKKQNEMVTTISPQLLLDFAIGPDNYLNLHYDGYFSLYRETKNFKKYIHKTDASWKWITPGGTLFKIGTAMDFNSIQPYSLHDGHKDFSEKRFFAETGVEAGTFIGMGIAYDRTVRRFNQARYSMDDFDRDTVTLRVAYKRLPDITIDGEYAFFHQNNKDRGPFTDLDSHVVLIGAQWDPSKRLFGHLKAGYYLINSTGNIHSSGLALDTDIGYRLTDITILNIVAYRRAVTSTRTARETGEYYISTGGGIKVSYSGFHAFLISANFLYTNNQFKQSKTEMGPKRSDDYFDLGVSATYDIREWCSFSTNYHHRVNNSTLDGEGFRENRIEAQFRFVL